MPPEQLLSANVLIMEPDTLLHLFEAKLGVVIHHTVVEPMEQLLQLRDEAVLVAWVADQGASGNLGRSFASGTPCPVSLSPSRNLMPSYI